MPFGPPTSAQVAELRVREVFVHKLYIVVTRSGKVFGKAVLAHALHVDLDKVPAGPEGGLVPVRNEEQFVGAVGDGLEESSRGKCCGNAFLGSGSRG